MCDRTDGEDQAGQKARCNRLTTMRTEELDCSLLEKVFTKMKKDMIGGSLRCYAGIKAELNI